MLVVVIVTASCGATPTSPTGTPISARVVTIRARVQDSVSRPIVDARVTIVDGPLAGFTTTTSDDGRFTFASFTTPAELTALRVEKAGYTPSNPRWRAPDDITVLLRSLASLDIEGQYTITFGAAAECTQLPCAVRSPTFTATTSRVPDPTMTNYPPTCSAVIECKSDHHQLALTRR